MAEVELASELLILGMAGLQDKKKSIDTFYDRNDDSFDGRRQIEQKFKSSIDSIYDACGDILRDSEFRRVPLFYSLFGATYHRLFSVPGLDLATRATGKLNTAEKEGLGDMVRSLSNHIIAARAGESVPRRYIKFVNACLSQTDNLAPRVTRLDTVYSTAFPE